MHNELNIHELITLYLDGETAPQEEQELFAALARDPALQQEFRYAVQMKTLLQPDDETVPSEIDTALFTQLGFGEEKKKRQRILPFFFFGGGSAAVRYAVAASLLLAVIGGVSFLPFGSDTATKSISVVGDSGIQSDRVETSQAQVNNLQSRKEQDTPINNWGQNKENNPMNNGTTQVETTEKGRVAKSVYPKPVLHKPDELSNLPQTPSLPSVAERTPHIQQQEQTPLLEPNTMNSSPAENNNRSIVINPPTKEDIKTIQTNPALSPTIVSANKAEQQNAGVPTSEKKFSFEARGGQSFATNQQTYIGNTIALTGMYKLGSSDWVGIVAGRDMGSASFTSSSSVLNLTGTATADTFNENTKAQRYAALKDSVTTAITKTWVGAVYEKRFHEVVTNLQPMARLMLGSYGSDPFSKVGTGVLYRIAGNLRCSLGLEGTMIFEKEATVRNLGAVGGIVLEF